jgi:succinate dehydrogenase assembly factor 1
MSRHSNIQKQILSLYKEFLKTSKGRTGMAEHITGEFRKNASIPKADTMRIEHMFRRGQRQLDVLKKSTVRGISVYQRETNAKS